MSADKRVPEAVEAGGEPGTWAWMEAPGKRFLEGIAPYWWVVLTALFLCAALPVLGFRPYRFEEGRRVAQVIAFFDAGLWLRLEIFGEAYANKPPLLPWLIAIAAKALGHIDEFAARLPSVIAIAATILSAGLMAGRAAERRPHIAAFAAGAFVMAAPVVLGRIRLAETDATATALAAGAFLFWALARLRHGREVDFISWCGVALCIAAALLAKGPPPLLFPLAAMVIIPLRERNWRQLGALGLTLVAASLPLAYWLYANIDVTSAAHLSSEMRLRPAGLAGLSAYFADLPELLASGTLQFLPAIVLAVIWIGRRKAWSLASGWFNHALFLFAVPTSVLLLFWPTSEARYLMPALWPIAVMAGLLVAQHWRVTGMSSLLVATLLAFVVIEGVFVVREGRTATHVEGRQMAEALAAAMAPLPPGKVLIWTVKPKPNYNLYVYMGRNARLVSGATLACTQDEPYLLADDDRAPLIDAATWSPLGEIQGADMTLYQRRDGTAGC